jgi:type IV secretory pathway VirB10-like protein
MPNATNGGARDDRFARLAGSARPTTIRTSIEPAPGPLAIQAGTLIPAVLLTGIDSDLPGDVLAHVARDVYDSRSMRSVLIPKGSKLLGKYEDQVGLGQDRLLIAWTRIVFPDGRSVALPGLETKDRTGAGGLHDRVDRHMGRAFGTASLLSLIGAGLQLSQAQGATSPFGSYASPQQVAAASVGQELAQVATQMLRRDLEVRPTIRIRQGMPFNVFFNVDLAFEESYLARR